MVIISERVGQLCNRLFHFSYFIANAIEYRYKVINPCFDEYSVFFESTLTNNFLDYSVTTKITPFRLVDRAIIKYTNNIVSFSPKTHLLDIRAGNCIYDLKNDSYQKLVHQKMVFTKGWLFKDEENLKKHRDVLLRIFKPLCKYTDDIKQLISDLKNDYDYIIGVHIRRGDYLKWQDGIYFFPDEVYAEKMKAFEQLCALKGKSCCFFICSNEYINKKAFSQFNSSIAKRHFISDLYALAECDYIMGPPSTFSHWASFYGNKPLMILGDAADEVTLEKFLYY